MDLRRVHATLGTVLADTYVIMLKHQSVHWNVVGDEFYDVHTLTETQYNELFLAVDEIAERIRITGGQAPGTMKEFLSLARLAEGNGGANDAAMMKELARAHRELAGLLRGDIDIMDDEDDYGSEDILVQRLKVHEKAAWMWESIISRRGDREKGDHKSGEPVAERPVKAEKAKSAPEEEKKSDSKPAKAEVKAEAKAEGKPAPKAEAKPAPKPETKPEPKADAKPAKKEEPELSRRPRLFRNVGEIG